MTISLSTISFQKSIVTVQIMPLFNFVSFWTMYWNIKVLIVKQKLKICFQENNMWFRAGSNRNMFESWIQILNRMEYRITVAGLPNTTGNLRIRWGRLLFSSSLSVPSRPFSVRVSLSWCYCCCCSTIRPTNDAER